MAETNLNATQQLHETNLKNYAATLGNIGLYASQEIKTLKKLHGLDLARDDKVLDAYYQQDYRRVFDHAILSVDAELLTREVKEIAAKTQNVYLLKFATDALKSVEKKEEPEIKVLKHPVRGTDVFLNEVSEALNVLREAKKIEQDFSGKELDAEQQKRYDIRDRDFKALKINYDEVDVLAEKYNANRDKIKIIAMMIDEKKLPTDVTLADTFDVVFRGRMKESAIGGDGLQSTYVSFFEGKHAANVRFQDMLSQVNAEKSVSR